MRFTTAETDAYVAWETLQTLFPTRTACGATYRSARGPFCRGDEDAWRCDQADARALDAAFSCSLPERAPLYERLAELLDQFPDTAAACAAVAQGRTLSEAQLATLHRAIHLAIGLDTALAQVSLRFSWWDSAAAQPFIQLVGGGDSAFCLDALDASLRAASDASARARLALDQVKRNVSRALHDAYGRAMRRDGTLIAPLHARAKQRCFVIRACDCALRRAKSGCMTWWKMPHRRARRHNSTRAKGSFEGCAQRCARASQGPSRKIRRRLRH
ncbi:hypothetical protein [Ferroacidibacillus organovorans]|uniref:Uncharacterized protein n=1 Tax=Ferroacidibacillus organovorans TaxID=1765683 RepID=A0A101XSA8_9BACL|nr:hypothetical protein [Ferroacidibacillus organovorans]KUO96623.1 hypothetical protein ATW55_00660 [Ferroacidibacillus organovorans]